ncbi:PREDICTED: protein RRP5 homolog [Vollenhovia emeryi]|uniref:protein RRP5 homolog n=1 Tax=Vollenhovia emeryi TaxID=411798 RepID=UPI0005F44EE9|nr:PREDICTED: protein RRP5 homolog [Vollenhovia emeryi]
MESFPRGGKKPGTKRSATTTSKDELKPKKRKIQTKEKTAGKEKTNIALNIAQQFSKQQLCKGYVLLGRIRCVKQFELIVSLPDGLVGSVDVSDISKAYTKQLEDLIAMVKGKVPVSLTHMFKYGDYVTCYVVVVRDLSSDIHCSLSLDPELINQNISINYLAKGSTIVCSVKCIEEHGYLMDTGIGVEAFLAYDQVEKGKQYFTGSQILCAVKNFDTISEPSFIQLTAKKTRIDRVNSHVKSWDVLTPGTKLLLRVTTVLSDGLRVTFGEDNVGYINQIYLSNPLSTYTVNMEVIGTLLYRQLLAKFAYFSLLTNESEKEMLRVGDIIERAKCLYKVVDGVVLKLSKSRGLRGYVAFLKDNSGLYDDSTKFEVGSTYKCRVVSYNLLQHLYVCTTDASHLKEIYFSASDFNIGDVHDVAIFGEPTDNYVAVGLGMMYGIVPREHISDSGINCMKRLGTLHKVQARVLDVDRDKNRVNFTLKRSLVHSQLPILQDFGEAKCGSKYHGTVSFINRNGLLVRFYGLVEGWVSRATLNPDTEHMNWNFFIGQTVTVRVESVEKDKRRMNLTIVKEKKRPVDLFVGEMVKGTVSERTYKGIYVKLQTKDDEAAVTAFLPAAHMALCTEIGAVLTARYAPGDVINSIVFATAPTVLLTHTLVTQHKYRNFDSLKVGDSIPSSVWEILPNGVKVVLPIDNYFKFGFVSRKRISNFEKLRVNQILFVKITAINSQERQLTLTMSLKAVYECLTDYEDKMTTAVGILRYYLSTQQDQEDIYEQVDKPISSVYLGQKVVGVVEDITEDIEKGLLFRVSDGLNCIVRKEHCIGNPKLGDSVCGTIMWKNYPHNILNVTLVKSIGNGITLQNMQLPELPTGVMLKAKILLVLDWFVLILVKHNGLGHLAALPVRRHINDIAPDLTPYKIHTKIRVYVVMTKSDTGSIPICLLKSAFEVPKSMTVSKISATKTKHVKKKKVSEREEALASNQIPNSVDQFNKLVLANPDSSLLWMQYMACYLQATEINKARAVARVALKKIHFKQYNDLWNVWKAWINLESRYGTAESLNDVFQKAIKKNPRNNPREVCRHMLTVHEDAGRKKELMGLIKTITGSFASEFKYEPGTWIKCCSALLKLGLKKKSRRLMRQSLNILPSELRPYMLIQFGILENTLGDSEEAEGIFEMALSFYPKHSYYIWSDYADSFIKSNNIDFARKVLERACAQTFPMKNMKPLFMKWINLEVKYGTPEAVARVRQMAADYGSKCI